jgi:PAS domain S-box-containing protein
MIHSGAEQRANFSQPLANLHILVADDNPTNRKLLRVLLEVEGHTVLEANNGVTALQILEQNHVDAVISDILMPEMDGFRLCYEIRKTPKLKHLPFAVYTASYVSSVDEQVALQFGVDKFIRKPASRGEIIDSVYEMLAATKNHERKDVEIGKEAELMQGYSQVLVKKLERTIVELSVTNQTLAERTALAEFLATVSAALAEARGLKQMLQSCCDAMISHLDVALARIWRFNEKEHVLELQGRAGMDSHNHDGQDRIPVGQDEIGLIALQRTPRLTNLVVNNSLVNDQESPQHADLVTFAGYPLMVGERLVGVLAVNARKALSQASLEVMRTVTHNIAVGIQRKLAERELRESEERFRSMIEHVKDHAVFMLDTEGRVLMWNNGAERLTGFSAEESIGTSFSRFFTAEDCATGKPEALLRAALNDGQSENEGWRVRKDGSRIWADLVITAVRGGGEKLVGFSAVTRDLTKRMLGEEALRQAKEEAEAANEAKSAFLANISHEIRTPMTGIIGMTGLLFDTELSDKQREYCEIIKRSSDSLLTVINEVLDFSKVEAGKLDLEIIDFDLRSAVEEVTALFAQQAADKGIELMNFIRYDVPEKLQGDPGRLRQILSNLVGNALKFTSKGQVVVQVNVVEQDNTAATLRFEVSDTGIGVDRETVDKLFKAFIQADASITRKYGGTGLGLALCKKFVDLMQGQIGVNSEIGCGSTFWFIIQLFKCQDSGRTTPQSHADLSGLRMLIVDGNATSRAVFDHYLRYLGIRGQSAENGRVALELLQVSLDSGEPYDVALLDMKIPGMGGMELARTIRQDPRFDSVKLLLLTAVGKRGDAALAQQAGIDGYLTKPLGVAQLQECLALMLGRSPTGSSCGSLVTQHSVAERREQHRLRVLVADDNHINQKVTTSLLEKMGHRADVAGNGKEAVEAYKLVPYDVVLLDLQMPEMDGFEACRHIRSLQHNRDHQAIIAITAHAVNGFKEKCLRAGFDDYVSKPILPLELKAAIERTAMTNGGSDGFGRSPNPADGEVVDIADALARLEGNQELFGEIVQMFLEQYPRLLAEIHRSLSSADCHALTSAVHTLGSSAGQVGANKALAIARRIEGMGDQEDLAGVPEILAQLGTELALVESALGNRCFQSAPRPTHAMALKER